MSPPKLLPQVANIFTRIYPSYSLHFATLPLSCGNTADIDDGYGDGLQPVASCVSYEQGPDHEDVDA